MAMSRKHYEEVAAIIKRERDLTSPVDQTREINRSLVAVAGELASMFKRDNASFDRAKFMEACGL